MIYEEFILNTESQHHRCVGAGGEQSLTLLSHSFAGDAAFSWHLDKIRAKTWFCSG